ncbi:MAG: YIP1 family protein [Bacillota bacterium]
MEGIVSGEKMSLWKRLYGVIWGGPARTMEDIVQKPASLGAVLLIMAVNIVLTLMTAPKIKEFTAWTLQNLPGGGKLPAEQMAIALNAAVISAVAASVLLPLIMWVVVAGLLKLFNAFAGEKASFASFFAVSVFGNLPAVLDGIIKTLLVMLTPAQNMARISISPVVFLPDPGLFPGKAYVFLSQVDPFIFWALGLTALGASIAMRVSFGRVAIYLGSLWLVYALIVTFVSGMGRAA